MYLALAVLVTYQFKDLFHLINLAYGVIAGIVGYQYYRQAMAALQEPEELDIPVIRLTVWVGILTGFVLIGTIRFALRRQIRGFSLWYSLLVGGFFALIIWYRNTRGWPIYLVCAFTLFYLNMAAWKKKEALLRNLCNGILLHFGAMVIYCLLHRPYMFFQYYRYPFIFHTVTISAVYLALVVCAALVKFLDVYRRTPHFAYPPSPASLPWLSPTQGHQGFKRPSCPPTSIMPVNAILCYIYSWSHSRNVSLSII